MSVNSMAIEDVYALLNVLHSQATGHSSVAPTSLADYISMATETLQAGTDTVYNELMQTIGKTIFSSRPYAAKFKGIQADGVRWGGIVRKISIADRVAPQDYVYHNNADGASVDPWEIRKSNVLEMKYYGTDVYEDFYTTFETQIINAFQSPEALGSFVALQTSEMSNKWEQYKEELVRANLCNFIAAKTDANNSIVHLLTEYNTLSGQSLTAQDIYLPQNMPDFFRWVRARINTLARLMSERSQLFQVQVTGKEISRHTPADKLKIYLLADALDRIDMMVNTITYHDEPLAYADVEGVSYWQAIQAPDQIQVTPVVMGSNGAVTTGNAQTLTDVFGVMFDEDAIAYNVKDYSIMNTPMNARGRYINTFLSANIQQMQDLTEKGIVLMLD